MDLKFGEPSSSGTEQPQVDRLSSPSGHVCGQHIAVIDTVVVMPLLTCDRQTYWETKEVRRKEPLEPLQNPSLFCHVKDCTCQRPLDLKFDPA